MHNPLITFIIPQYNKPLVMLRECIESVLALNLEAAEREIIVVDDGSTERAELAVKGMGEDIVYVYQDNQGLSVARNNAIEMAHGEYIQFLDSDDYLVVDSYNRLIQHIKQQRMDMLMFRFTNEPPHGNCRNNSVKESLTAGMLVEETGVEHLLTANIRAAACVYIFRRALLSNLRFCPGIFHEDALFTPQLMLRVQAFCEVDEKAYFYRQNENTIMSNRDNRHIEKRLSDSLYVLEQLKRVCDTLDGKSRNAMQRCLAQQTMNHLYFVITLTRSLRTYRSHAKTLKAKDLYPLPLRKYTWKYLLFAIATKMI